MELEDITFVLDLYPGKIKLTHRITQGDYITFYNLVKSTRADST